MEEKKLHITPRTSQNSGITLVALIITIIVLLILAVVAIRAVTGDGIINYAKNAQTGYEEAQAKENSTLSYYETYLYANGEIGKWVQKEETKTVTDLAGKAVEVKIPSNTISKVNSDGTVQEIKIGAYVNYNPKELKEGIDETKTTYTSVGANNTLAKNSETGEYIDQIFDVKEYTGKWKVLGIENGKILLVSESNIKNYEMNSGQVYIIGKTELNNICAIYGNGKGAESARSIKVEDVNKITGYTPETFAYDNAKWGRYGVTTTFTFDGTNLLYSTSKGDEGSFAENKLTRIVDNKWVGGGLKEGETYEITNGNYTYLAKDNTDNLLNMSMNENSNEYKLIFIGSNYWLASKSANCYHEGGSVYNKIFLGLRYVASGTTYDGVSGSGANGSNDATYTRGGRPVIVLDVNTDLVLNSDGSYDIK